MTLAFGIDVENFIVGLFNINIINVCLNVVIFRESVYRLIYFKVSLP